MKKLSHLLQGGIAAALLLSLAPAWSQSTQMNYQGRLTDASGNPVADGQQTISFSLWDAATGGNRIWGPFTADNAEADGHGPVVQVVNGRFNTVLGPLDTGKKPLNLAFNGDRYLEIKVGNNAPITPRQKLLAAPLAMKADIASAVSDGAISTAMIQNGAITPDKMSPGNPSWASNGTIGISRIAGSVGIGTAATATDKLTVSGTVRLDNTLLLKGGADLAHGLAWNAKPKDWIPAPTATIDGPVLFGWEGGALATVRTKSMSLNWNAGGVQIIGDPGSLTTSPAVPHMLITTDRIQAKTKADIFATTTLYVNAVGGDVIMGNSASTLKVPGTISISGKSSAPLPIHGFLNPDGAGIAGAATSGDIGLYVNNEVAASIFRAFSDARIKKVDGRSDAAADLRLLDGIEITDYHYIDKENKGGRGQKKVIAQQVEKIFPQAVALSTGVIPDIYRKASVKDGWVLLDTDLKAGEKVKLIGDTEEKITEVKEIRSGAFRPAETPKGDLLFVYGREVNDFRTVDYEAISMLNVSATQELARQVKAKDEKIAALEKRITEIEGAESRLAALEKSVAVLVSTANAAPAKVESGTDTDRPAEPARRETAAVR